MAKLYFRYAVMNAGKTTQLLQIAHDYETNNKKNILVLKPGVDTKAKNYVITRIRDDLLKRECDFLIKKEKGYLFEKVSEYKDISIILIDEAQFLSKENVWDLARIVTRLNIPVICFGLKSDFRGEPFEGSSHLFAMAQDIEEVTTRAICRRHDKATRATMNMRTVDGKVTFKGDQVGIETGNVIYQPVCLKTFMDLYEKNEE